MLKLGLIVGFLIASVSIVFSQNIDEPSKLFFMTPPSNGLDIIYPGTLLSVKVLVFDKNGNIITTPATVSLSSAEPNIGDVYGANQIETENGIALFKVKVGDSGVINDMIHLTAKLVNNGATDYASLIVGKRDVAILPVKNQVALNNNWVIYEIVDLQGRIIKRIGNEISYKNILLQMKRNAILSHGVYIVKVRTYSGVQTQATIR